MFIFYIFSFVSLLQNELNLGICFQDQEIFSLIWTL